MRLRYPYMNLERKEPGEMQAIRRHAEKIKQACTSESFL